MAEVYRCVGVPPFVVSYRVAMLAVLPPPVFAGFQPKVTLAAPDEYIAWGVSEIAAVSECLSRAPEGWIDAWKHNSNGFYDSEELARSIIRDEKPYDLYAYEVFPIVYADIIEPYDAIGAPGPVPADYEMLGYDIVSRSIASFFECSVLSCNGLAKTFPVNRHCLIEALGDAWDAFQHIGAEEIGCEPGPYYLFAVHRKRR